VNKFRRKKKASNSNKNNKSTRKNKENLITKKMEKIKWKAKIKNNKNR
jgi:hypothetical protein